MERPIEATTQIRATFERARDLLLHDPAAVLGATSAPARSKRTFVVELSAKAGRGGTVHELVELEILGVHLETAAARWDLTWHAVGHARLFPVFRGALTITAGGRTTLRLAGTYKPPLGLAGVFGDGVLGHRIARRTLASYVAALGRRIDGTAADALARGPSDAPTREPLRG
jgi:hypothetical protein